MNKEKLKQITINALKSDDHDFMGCKGLKIEKFECYKAGKNISCQLIFKDTNKTFDLLVTPSVSYWDEVNK